jgi:hypothetical protein
MSKAIARRIMRCVCWNKPSIIWGPFFSKLRKIVAAGAKTHWAWLRQRRYRRVLVSQY